MIKYLSSTRKSSMMGRSLTPPFIINNYLSSMRKLLHEGEELHLPFFINNYLSSMRKSSMRGRSLTSLFYQQLPELNEEVLHEGEELHPEVREALQEVQGLLYYPATSSSGGTRRLIKSRLCAGISWKIYKPSYAGIIHIKLC
jgi:hypothetical protein